MLRHLVILLMLAFAQGAHAQGGTSLERFQHFLRTT